MVDLNADVGTIVKQLFGKGGPKKAAAPKGAGMAGSLKYVILFGIGVVMATAAYVQFYYLPKQRALTQQIAKLEETKKMQAELKNLDAEKKKLVQKLDENHERYGKVIRSFGANGQIEELYRAISDIAKVHSLTVVNIRGAEGAGTLLQDTVTEKAVNVELQGRFGQYVAFREKLMQEKPVLSVKSEAIEMGGDGQPGWITIRLVLLDYSIDRAAFEEVLDHGT